MPGLALPSTFMRPYAFAYAFVRIAAAGTSLLILTETGITSSYVSPLNTQPSGVSSCSNLSAATLKVTVPL